MEGGSTEVAHSLGPSDRGSSILPLSSTRGSLRRAIYASRVAQERDPAAQRPRLLLRATKQSWRTAWRRRLVRAAPPLLVVRSGSLLGETPRAESDTPGPELDTPGAEPDTPESEPDTHEAEAPKPGGVRRGYYLLNADGGNRGDRLGRAAIGALVRTRRLATVAQISTTIGPATHNVAEYQALIEGLKLAHEQGVERIRVYMDSEIVVDQVNGVSAVRQAHLNELHEEARQTGS
jgi:hypothetical protein